MNQYLVLLRRDAQKQLDSIPGKDNEAIRKALHSLENEPKSHNVLKLTGAELWRLRVGKFHLIYSVDDRNKRIIVVKVSKRDENTYKDIGG